jgi:hypothetical protein
VRSPSLMRALRFGALALLLSATSGCVVWHSHLEPGVAGFPASLKDARHAPVRLLVTAAVPNTNPKEQAKQPWKRSSKDATRLVELVTEAGICSEAGTEMALIEGHLHVQLRERGLGNPGFAMLTAATVGLVPYYGGKRVTAEATLKDAKGRVRAEWTAVAEARLVGHLFFLTGWNLDALKDLRDNALRGVVVQLATEQRRLVETARPGAGDRSALVTASPAAPGVKRR